MPTKYNQNLRENWMITISPGSGDKNTAFNVEQEKGYYLCVDGIKKSVPRDHRLASLGVPSNDKPGDSGQIFLLVIDS